MSPRTAKKLYKYYIEEMESVIKQLDITIGEMLNGL